MSILEMAEKYIKLFDSIKDEFPEEEGIMISYAAKCISGNFRYRNETFRCDAPEDCLYKHLFDGNYLCTRTD